jgi:hypothetical protein
LDADDLNLGSMAMSGASILEKQLAFYKEAAESWKADHLTAMVCYELQDAIAVGLSILSMIDRRRVNAKECTVDEALYLQERYRWWHDRSLLLIRAIEHLESEGYHIDGAVDFRERFESLSCILDGMERIRVSLTELKEGKGMGLQEAIHALQAHNPTDGN